MQINTEIAGRHMGVISAVNNSTADRKLRCVNIYVCVKEKSFKIILTIIHLYYVYTLVCFSCSRKSKTENGPFFLIYLQVPEQISEIQE